LNRHEGSLYIIIHAARVLHSTLGTLQITQAMEFSFH